MSEPERSAATLGNRQQGLADPVRKTVRPRMAVDLSLFGNLDFEGYSSSEQAAGLLHVEPPISGVPPMYKVHNVYLYPYQAGVYDAEGRRLHATSPYYVADGVSVSLGDVRKYAKTEETVSRPTVNLTSFIAEHGEAKEITKPTLFLGNYSAHYGHWITDGMARLWAELGRCEATGRTFVPIFGAATLRERDYIRHVLTGLELEGFTSARPKRLRRYDTMLIPEPSFQLRHRIYRNAAQIHQLIASKIALDTTLGSRPVYLSRSKLERGMRSIVDEHLVEAVFERRGFDIVHPQDLSFESQVRLFNSAPVIAGFVGSSFHTGMFSLPNYRGTLLMLSGDDPLNGRLVLQGAIKNYRSIFARAYEYADNTVRPDVPLIRAIVRGLGL